MSAKQLEAAAALAGVGDDMWIMLADHFTCPEADVIAEFLTAFGQAEFAKQFLARHAEDDDEGDFHNPDGTPREVPDERTLR